MKILVTGASGLLGTRLCELAKKRNHQVYSIYSQHLPRCGTPFKLDIANSKDLERVFNQTKPQVVVHAAALTDVDKCETHKELALRINTEATANIARLCQKHDAFIAYVSTDYVFDGNKGNYKETDKPAPINHYGLTKLKGEESLKEQDIDCCIARTSVLYGANPSAGKTNFALWIINTLRQQQEARIVTDQWNSPTLNTNLAEMILAILETKTTGTIHLAGATRLSRYEFAKLIAETFSLDPNQITPVTSEQIAWSAKRPKDSSLNVDKAKRTLKKKPLPILKALATIKNEIKNTFVALA